MASKEHEPGRVLFRSQKPGLSHPPFFVCLFSDLRMPNSRLPPPEHHRPSPARSPSWPEPQSNASRTNNGTNIGVFFFLCRRRAQRQRAQIDAERAAGTGNYTLHPFVQDNRTGPTGNVFAQSALASSSNNASASALVPLRRDTLAAGAAANSSSAEGANKAAGVAGALATEQYPIEKTPLRENVISTRRR
uniref:Uncharacterized protein n=1 Tax=Mycena chlorophos TaxID=658473 RepID=A0ABQ0KTY6_MYCCL|nr:predicted protein [Mycena chlorophos]